MKFQAHERNQNDLIDEILISQLGSSKAFSIIRGCHFSAKWQISAFIKNF